MAAKKGFDGVTGSAMEEGAADEDEEEQDEAEGEGEGAEEKVSTEGGAERPGSGLGLGARGLRGRLRRSAARSAVMLVQRILVGGRPSRVVAAVLVLGLGVVVAAALGFDRMATFLGFFMASGVSLVILMSSSLSGEDWGLVWGETKQDGGESRSLDECELLPCCCCCCCPRSGRGRGAPREPVEGVVLCQNPRSAKADAPVGLWEGEGEAELKC